MTRLVLSTAVLLGALALPAFAFVDAPRALMAPDVSQALAARLENVGGYRFDAIVLQQAPEGPTVLADQVFAARQLGPSEGLIVVSVADGQVGAHLGTMLASRGLDAAAQRAVIDRAYAPFQAQHDLAGGIQAVAEGLAAYSPGAPEPASSGAGLWVWMAVALVVIAGAAVGILRMRREPAPEPVPLKERIAAIERERATGELPANAVPPPKPAPAAEAPPAAEPAPAEEAPEP